MIASRQVTISFFGGRGKFFIARACVVAYRCFESRWLILSENSRTKCGISSFFLGLKGKVVLLLAVCGVHDVLFSGFQCV